LAGALTNIQEEEDEISDGEESTSGRELKRKLEKGKVLKKKSLK